jgi:hypothetical protein
MKEKLDILWFLYVILPLAIAIIAMVAGIVRILVSKLSDKSIERFMDFMGKERHL